MPELIPAISRFYHRWHGLEENLGDKIEILDFDYCPREDLLELEPPFSDRKEALTHLEALRGRLAGTGPNSLRNAEFLTQKLTGSAAFLRALMGERIPFDTYLRATMGIEPEQMPVEELEAMRGELEQRFSEINIPFSPEGKQMFDRLMVMDDLSQFETNLRSEADRWVDIIQQRVGLKAKPDYNVDVVKEDAYWSNWISGSAEKGIRLRVNTHPRITFLKGSETGFAAHEIGAHALQILELDASRRAAQLDSAALNLTVHNCEQFQFEGLAQTVMFLVAREGEIPEELDLDLRLKFYHSALLNNAQIELEAGLPVDEVIDRVLVQAPFLKQLRVSSDVRDRGRHPLFRTYIHIYFPSQRKFLAAQKLSETRRREFLYRMYTQIWTAGQIDAMLKDLLALDHSDN